MEQKIKIFTGMPMEVEAEMNEFIINKTEEVTSINTVIDPKTYAICVIMLYEPIK